METYKVATTLAGNNVAINQCDAGSCDKKSEEFFHLVFHGNIIYDGSWSINNLFVSTTIFHCCQVSEVRHEVCTILMVFTLCFPSLP